MKTILITGAKGQLGNEIRAITDLKKDTNLHFIFTDIDELDITDIDALGNFFKKNAINYIVNCAAYTNVDKAESEPDKAELINSSAVKNLANISNTYSVPIIHLSTDYVFDGQKKTAYSELDLTNPVTVYGRTKLSGEEHASNAFKFMIIRTSWLYSKFGHNFVKTMLKLGAEKEEISVVNDQTGSPTNAADLAAAVIHILQMSIKDENNFKSGIYHYSNEGSCTWYEFASEIMKISNLSCEVHPIGSDQFPSIAKRPKYSLMDKTKIKIAFNLSIPHWQRSLKKCLSDTN